MFSISLMRYEKEWILPPQFLRDICTIPMKIKRPGNFPVPADAVVARVRHVIIPSNAVLHACSPRLWGCSRQAPHLRWGYALLDCLQALHRLNCFNSRPDYIFSIYCASTPLYIFPSQRSGCRLVLRLCAELPFPRPKLIEINTILPHHG